VRLLGVGVHNFAGQADFDADDERWPLLRNL
jgi:hypothetical protein